MNIHTWIEQTLWGENYFEPGRAGDCVEVFQCGVSFPLVASLIDGCHGTPQWARGASPSNTKALFDAIRPLVQRDGASWFYVTDPDNALSVLHWTRVINAAFFNEYVLQEFELNPAEEGGDSHLGIAFHHGEGLLVFDLSRNLTIRYYGSPARIAEFQACLSPKEAGDAESPLRTGEPAGTRQWSKHSVKGETLTDWECFHSYFEETFSFPGYYGRNMNAWIDCMSDYCYSEGPVCLHIDEAAAFKAANPAAFEALVECAAFINLRSTSAGGEPLMALSYYV